MHSLPGSNCKPLLLWTSLNFNLICPHVLQQNRGVLIMQGRYIILCSKLYFSFTIILC